MDIYDFALELEKNSEQYYRELAQRCDHPALNAILNMLAEDEVKHFRTIQAMRDGSHPEMTATRILRRSRDRFADLKTVKEKDFCFGMDEIAIYRKALEKEDETEKFYHEKAAEADDPKNAALFNRLADEERRHHLLIENMIEFLSRPKQWLENAEFHHLDEY